jgi:ABC-type sugar transport system permease subunit
MEKEKKRLAYLLLVPSGLWLFITIGLPILDTIRNSFYYSSYKGTRFVFLGNFQSLLTDEIFRQVLGNSVVWTVVCVALNVVLGLSVALLLSRASVVNEFGRLTLILAWATPTVVAAITWKWMLNSEYGHINALLIWLGVIRDPVQWLVDAKTGMMGAMAARLWSSLPFVTFAFLSGLQSIPTDLYEAATVDGSTGEQKFWYITLPLLKPVMLATLLLTTIWAFNAFVFIYVITGGGPANGTQIVVTEIYRRAFEYFEYGGASAIAVVAFVLLMTVSAVYWKLFYRQEKEA